MTALLVIGVDLDLRDPWPSGDPRFTVAARQMVESGHWLFPHRGIELYSDKPPMPMWLEAAFCTVTRNWRVAFLPPLPGALSSNWNRWRLVVRVAAIPHCGQQDIGT